MAINNRLGDLTPMCQEIEEVIKKHLNLKQKPAVALAFTCEITKFKEAHYVVNMDPLHAVDVFQGCADTIVKESK